MKVFAQRLKEERESKKKYDSKWTQGYVADLIGVARPTYTAYERGTKEPSMETVNKLADIFNVNGDYLTGRSNSRHLSEKDEKDIAKRLEVFREDLSKQDGLLFSGEPMSDEAKESLLEAMEYAFRQTQRINKKYVPKKYRKNKDGKD